jgi:hypothetical protein
MEVFLWIIRLKTMFGNNKRIVFLNFRRTVFVRLFYFLGKTKT